MCPKVSNQYKKEKKAELLEAAKKVFIRKGYIKATMQDIMDEAGISRGALYDYFDNIQHIFEELLKVEDEKDTYSFEKAAEYSHWQHLVDWIYMQQKNIDVINQSLIICKTEFFLTTYHDGNKTSNPYLIKRYEKLAASIKLFIEAGAENREFKPCMSSEAIALYLISFLDGLMLDTFNLGKETTKVNEQIEILIFTLEKMLCPNIEK